MKRALLYGIMASFFFSFTFVLNRSMQLSGGYWMWSASLRYMASLPFLALLVWKEGGFAPIFRDMGRNKLAWFIWSMVGFGLFYGPLTYASQFGTSWFASATFQITIVAGAIMSPLFGQPFPWGNIAMNLLILAGIFLLQLSAALSSGSGAVEGSVWLVLLPTLVAAFAYPLGNRKMMQICSPEITANQRVFGMTLWSQPLWIILAVLAWTQAGPPSRGQLMQSGIVGLFAGVVATVLLFRATSIVRHDPKQLALAEATQCGSVVFSTLGGIMFLKDPLPSGLGFFGILLIVAGMAGGSLLSVRYHRTHVGKPSDKVSESET